MIKEIAQGARIPAEYKVLKEGTLLNNDSESRQKGPIVISGRLGIGGFGITYEAQRLESGERYAVKEFFCSDYMTRDTRETNQVFLKENKDAGRHEHDFGHFFREAKTLSCFKQLDGVVKIHDCFQENDTAYIMMELLDGETISKFLRGKRYADASLVIRRFLPVIRSLKMVHTLGIIHRDISPENIMVLKDGSLRLIDFGSAVSFKDDNTRTVVLKEGDAPREQYSRKSLIGPWTDIYALCAVIYRVITGRTPDNAIQRSVYDEVEPPSAMGIEISEAIEAVLMRGLSVDGGARWQTMEELDTRFSEALEGKFYSDNIFGF